MVDMHEKAAQAVGLLTFAKASRAHEDHPERNEDYGLTDPASRLAVICDGVGCVVDTVGAGKAARLAARTARDHWRQVLATLAGDPARAGWPQQNLDLETILRQLLEEANRAVLALDARLAKRARANGENDEKQGYAATTIALALLLPQEDGYLVGHAHIGDSRVYLLRHNDTLQRLTADDGYFEWKIGQGELNAQEAWRIEQSSSAEQLSEQDRAHFDKRNRIAQSLGDEAITLHTGQVAIRAGDRLLLTTDGVHDNLSDAEIEETARSATRTTAARALLKRSVESSQQDQAVRLRAKKDDMSVIVITCHNPAEKSHEYAQL